MLKKILSSLTLAVAFTGLSQSQTLYAPTGTVGSSSNSNVGVGTNNPQASLDVRGNLVLERNNNPALFTGTGSSDLNRYLLLLNSPNYSSASGLKAGGLLISDSYAYANPGKNDLVVKGRIGIGTATLRNKLEVGSGFSFHDGGHKVIGFGYAPGYGNYATTTGYPAEIRYDPTGSLRFGISNQSIEAGSGMSGMNGWMLVLNKNGNVGVGKSTPSAKLHVNGNFRATEYIEVESGGVYRVSLAGVTDGQIRGRNNQSEMKFFINSNGYSYFNGGNIGIGTTSPDAPLTVAGNIHAREVKVTATAGGADFVFADDYQLPKLEAVASFVKLNKHLPEIPSAAEMEANGIHLAEMNIKLLQKVEELTLYAIEQENKLASQQAAIAAQQAQLDEKDQLLQELLRRMEGVEKMMEQ